MVGGLEKPVLEAVDLCFGFRDEAVLRDISLSVYGGEALAITGASGCGKSTLLKVLAGLLAPAGGAVYLDGRRIDDLPDRDRRRVRLEHFGFVFQFGDLIPELRAIENVMLPGRLLGLSDADMRSRATETLEILGVRNKADSRIGELSGGEMQRVAVARAICLRPAFVFADEPTGSLDDRNTAIVIDLLFEAVTIAGSALIMVTHDLSVASHASRQVRMENGSLVG